MTRKCCRIERDISIYLSSHFPRLWLRYPQTIAFSTFFQCPRPRPLPAWHQRPRITPRYHRGVKAAAVHLRVSRWGNEISRIVGIFRWCVRRFGFSASLWSDSEADDDFSPRRSWEEPCWDILRLDWCDRCRDCKPSLHFLTNKIDNDLTYSR